MSDYALLLNAFGLKKNEHVNLDLLSTPVHDPKEIAGFIVQGRREGRLPFYVAYHRLALEATRLRTMHELFKPGIYTHHFKRADLEPALRMPVIEITGADPNGLMTEVTKAIESFPNQDVCFIDLPTSETLSKFIDPVAFEVIERQLAEAVAQMDAAANAAAKANLNAIVRGGHEAIGWEDDTPDLRAAPAAVDPFEAAKQTRDRLLAKESWLDSKAVARAARNKLVESNPAQYASRLRREHRLFGVRWRGEYLHPAFQFQASGEVHPAMERLLAVLPTTDANWNAAFWLFERNGKVGGRRPADVFVEDPNGVIAAATEDFVRDNSEGRAVVNQGTVAHGG
jgi:hypothetical protein